MKQTKEILCLVRVYVSFFLCVHFSLQRCKNKLDVAFFVFFLINKRKESDWNNKMSKRMAIFQYRQPRSKMPKLDITISSSQRISTAGPSNLVQPRVDPPPQTDDAWGEDDDEFFVLASQAAEQVEANAAVVISQAMNNRQHDMSYIRFRQDVRTTHSTQLNHIDEFDNDEDIFSNLPDFIPNQVPKAGPSIENKENNHAIHKQQNSTNQPSTSTASRISTDDKAKERKEKIQTEYYAQKLKEQKKQIETISETLNKVNQEFRTKEGEASTLRYAVEQKSKEIDKLRKEKMDEAVEMEKKFSEKIIALEKKIEEQRSELEFKVFTMNFSRFSFFSNLFCLRRILNCCRRSHGNH